MEKPGSLLLLQIDHLSGEEIGYLIEVLYDWGTRNVHVIPTLTKKNRPGYLVLIDASEMNEDKLSKNLASQFGISGYHKLETAHCYQNVNYQIRQLVIHYKEQKITTELQIKTIGDQNMPLFLRTEYDGIAELCRLIHQKFGINASLSELRHFIERQSALNEETIEIKFGSESGQLIKKKSK